ncbi:MAG: hypothetical protein WKF58_09390 [Ilumatobacteraceae bacterium]
MPTARRSIAGAEQVVQELRRRQQRPHPFERCAHVAMRAHAGTDLAHLRCFITAPARGQARPQLVLDEAPAGVVPPEPPPCCLHDAHRLGDGQPHVPRPERHDEVVAQRPLAISDGTIDDVAHAGVPLHTHRFERLVRLAGGGELHPRHEVGEHDLVDAGLSERGQDLVDVAEEDGVGPDDEHTLVLQREPVRVQQVCGTVQRDDGLAGAGSALHDQHTGLWRADDLVLLALDRGHDVAERSRAAALERRQQRRVATQSRAGCPVVGEPVVLPDAEVAGAEEFVFQAEQRPSLDGEVPPPGQTHRLTSGGAVEGLGHRRPPVDDDRFAFLVGHCEAADVVRLVVGAVDAPEHEGSITEIEIDKALDQGFVDGVALEPRLERAAEIGFVQGSRPPSGLASGFETRVCVVDMCLLRCDLWVMLRHRGGGVPRLCKRGRPTLPAVASATHEERCDELPHSDGRRAPRPHAGVVHAPGRTAPPRVPSPPW